MTMTIYGDETDETYTVHSEVKQIINSNPERHDFQDDSLQTPEENSQPNRYKGELSRRGSPYNKEPRPSLVHFETTNDAPSILGQYPACPTPCPMCCVDVVRTSWRYVFS